MADESLSEAEFEKWVRPPDAVAMLPWNFETTARTVSGRLEAALIRAVARTGRHRSKVETMVPIPASMWEHWACLADYDFWQTGDVTFHRGGSYLADFYDVRFDPAGIAELLPPSRSPDAASADAAPAEKPTVSKDDIAKWHEVFKAVHPGAPEALAVQSAVAMFPDKHVPRQYVRDLRGPQKRGKPPSRRE